MYGPDLAWIHHTGFSEFAESAAPFIVSQLARHEIRRGRIVDAGCGSGVLARKLVDAGFEVEGFDASSAMIELARAVAPAARFEVARLDRAIIPPCVAITAVGEVLSYSLPDEAEQFLERASEALQPGGLLIFDVVELDAYPERDERRVGGADWSVIAVKERHARTVTRTIDTFREIGGSIRRDREVHTIHLHDRAYFLRLLRDRGFRVRVRRSYGSRRLPRGHAVYIARR